MSDLIRRSDAIKAVWGDDINPSEDGMVFEAQSHIDRDMRLIPSADRPQGWIPCSERLPSESGYYLCCNNGYLPYVGHFINGRWSDFDCTIVHADAWMPLPKPWKGADDEND